MQRNNAISPFFVALIRYFSLSNLDSGMHYCLILHSRAVLTASVTTVTATANQEVPGGGLLSFRIQFGRGRSGHSSWLYARGDCYNDLIHIVLIKNDFCNYSINFMEMFLFRFPRLIYGFVLCFFEHGIMQCNIY